MTIAIGCDEAAYEFKEAVKAYLIEQGQGVEDYGVYDLNPVLYPDIALKVAEAVAAGKHERGILVCGTGIGMSIVANRHRGVRAALCTDPYMARMSREHNDANVLCLGGRVIGRSLAEDVVRAFLDGEFGGERHARRLAKLDPS